MLRSGDTVVRHENLTFAFNARPGSTLSCNDRAAISPARKDCPKSSPVNDLLEAGREPRRRVATESTEIRA
jgi:hypothetical protein